MLHAGLGPTLTASAPRPLTENVKPWGDDPWPGYGGRCCSSRRTPGPRQRDDPQRQVAQVRTHHGHPLRGWGQDVEQAGRHRGHASRWPRSFPLVPHESLEGSVPADGAERPCGTGYPWS